MYTKFIGIVFFAIIAIVAFNIVSSATSSTKHALGENKMFQFSSEYNNAKGDLHKMGISVLDD